MYTFITVSFKDHLNFESYRKRAVALKIIYCNLENTTSGNEYSHVQHDAYSSISKPKLKAKSEMKTKKNFILSIANVITITF